MITATFAGCGDAFGSGGRFQARRARDQRPPRGADPYVRRHAGPPAPGRPRHRSRRPGHHGV